MATDKQTEANRQNAQKSTGPRTAEGKARSSMNHLTTGIDAKSAIIPGEDPAQLQALADRIGAELKPATEAERHQVDIKTRHRGRAPPGRYHHPLRLEGPALCPLRS
ncbi:hypothetical protein SBA4_2360006 [Candidatus Sulfopaludibacter sp. SbA4]|nr:hypothetical protein SBA4_2360006 [Candidatus Sulfopaludibacter sp. SbA4]